MYCGAKVITEPLKNVHVGSNKFIFCSKVACALISCIIV